MTFNCFCFALALRAQYIRMEHAHETKVAFRTQKQWVQLKLVGLSIQDEAIHVARLSPYETHSYEHRIELLP